MTGTGSGDLTSRFGIGAGSLFPAPTGGPLRLIVLTRGEAGRRHTLPGESVLIGRAEECTIQLDDTRVSRRHARLTLVGEDWVIEDLESRNGTMVNGKLLDGPRTLQVGDRIQLSGETLLLFTRQDPLEDVLLHRQQMEVIGQLAAGIAHDFNNLLNVISASAAHLASLDPATSLGDGDVRECHADIRAAAQRAAELTARLLTIARRRKGAEETPEVGPVDLSTLSRDVLSLVRRTFDRSIEIEAEIEDRLAVDGEPGALHQLLMNLCINARDAMPEGGTLTLVARGEGPLPDLDPACDPHPQVVIEVRDTGIGMDEATRARVFEPFFTTKETGAGSGLGLATVYEVATNHGGLIEVESAPGEGSTFRVRLPRRFGKRTPSHGVARRRMPTWDTTHVATVGRVLVVDDQELVRRSLGRLLRAAGHEVCFAADGREALEAYEDAARRPDVVLMDLDMPHLSGSQTLERMRKIDPEARVVLISGYDDEPRRRRLLDLGAVDFLAKPVDASKLRETIRLALAVPQGGE